MQAIGVVGPIASGKGVVLDLLRERGFIIYSLSDTLRNLAALSRFDPTRELLQDLGDLYRKHGGDGRLAELTIEGIPSHHRAIGIDSIRNPGEIDVLRRELNIKIIGVDADAERRYGWMLERHTHGDPITWEEFQRLGNRDLGIDQAPHGQQVNKCLEIADIVIQNDDTKERLRERIEDWLISIDLEGNPPAKESRS